MNDITKMTLRDIMQYVADNYGLAAPISELAGYCQGHSDGHNDSADVAVKDRKFFSAGHHYRLGDEWFTCQRAVEACATNPYIVEMSDGAPCDQED